MPAVSTFPRGGADVLRTGRLAIVVVVLLGAARAEAQTQWDAAGAAGLLSAGADAGTEAGYADEWSNAAQGGAVIGRYLSRHLKLELEASATTLLFFDSRFDSSRCSSIVCAAKTARAIQKEKLS